MDSLPPSPGDIARLVQPGRVHRAAYIDPAIFDLEMRLIFGRAWLYLCHESQVAEPGSFFTTVMGREPVIVSRDRGGALHVLFNRCTHRGAKLATDETGTAKRFVCCYHGWAFELDGKLAEVPLPEGYGGMPGADGSLDLVRVPRVATYRGFIFASRAKEGPSLSDWLGPIASSFDDMVDRAPGGVLEVAGGVSRHAYDGNWKLVIENHNDTLHPRFVHASSVAAARDQSDAVHSDGAGEVQIKQMRQNGAPAHVWEALGIWTTEWGHSFMGDYHTDARMAARGEEDPVEREYREALEKTHGAERAREIMGVTRFNSIVYPNLSFMSRFRQLRVVQPVSVNRTVVVTYTFRMPLAPERMFRDSIAFANVVNGAGSLVLTDDLETYARVQDGLASQGGDWVDVQRGLGGDQDEANGMLRGQTGTSEIHLRAQFAAWQRWMTP
ncbi:aromatic ring-hydroxylating oxygenase subunit alpha [Falsiroseomonas sp.]|uniref:aromatic ring-hydroxylating oxygenase subunit alpha n=1 Tax=Falsiroseomonas sp. TaxID=2870721 RepID=UPI0035643026